MSDKYINANDLFKRRQGCKKDCKSCDFWKDGDSWCNGQLFVVDLLHAPAADVMPVVRGKWMFEGSIENTWKVFTCSKCGASCIDGGDFCPNCGAKMETGE